MFDSVHIIIISEIVNYRCGLRKTGKIFSFHNEQDSMKHGEKWFPEKNEKIVTRYAELPPLSSFS